MISEGLNLAMYGMGIVFVFLVLLIYVTKLMSSVAQKLDAAAGATLATTPNRSAAAGGGGGGGAETARLKAVLAEAVKQYRANH